MKALLDASKITKEEKEQNPEAVYQALRYLQDPKNHSKADKFMTQDGQFSPLIRDRILGEGLGRFWSLWGEILSYMGEILSCLGKILKKKSCFP